jgi:hypothetical protein
MKKLNNQTFCSSFKWVLLTAAFFIVTSCSEHAVYVSPEGDDQQEGTRRKPVATLQKAVELAEKNQLKHIIVGEGDYYDVSVVISEKDSGLVISGEKGKLPRLFGGKRLTHWQRNGNYLETQIPDHEWPELDFRILVVNDSLRDRARLPEKGAFNHRNEWPHQWQSSQGGWSQKPTEKDLTTLYYNPDDLGPWLDINNAEVTVFHAWDDSYTGVASIDTTSRSITFSNKLTHPPGAYASWAGEKTMQYIVWNIREGMTRPGQWFVDRTNRKVVYWPFPHEKEETLMAMVPSQNHFFRIEEGTKNVTLQNLQMMCAGAPVSNTGYGTYAITGAILADQAENLVLNNLSVKNVAGWAVKLTGSNIYVTGCEFSYTGAGGLSYSGNNIRIERCGLHDLGKLYFGAVGIMGSGSKNLVSHCELYNIPYCAINGVGKYSVAEYNLIYNFKQMMVDGGAIYCYGGDSTIYRKNAVLYPTGNATEGWTYYFDELSINCIMENNLAVNTIVPMHHHMAEGVTIRNNLFIDEGHQKISYPLSSNLQFSDNIFIADEVLFSGPNGETGTTAKESLNTVFQKYYNCNGITAFERNQFYTNNISHDVLHVYNRIRTETFAFTGQDGNKLYGVKDKMTEVPESFDQTGYRGNFRQLYHQMTGLTD